MTIQEGDAVTRLYRAAWSRSRSDADKAESEVRAAFAALTARVRVLEAALQQIMKWSDGNVDHHRSDLLWIIYKAARDVLSPDRDPQP